MGTGLSSFEFTAPTERTPGAEVVAPDPFPENLGGVEAGLALPGVHSPSHAGS